MCIPSCQLNVCVLGGGEGETIAAAEMSVCLPEQRPGLSDLILAWCLHSCHIHESI